MRTLAKVLSTLFILSFTTLLQAETLSEAMQSCSRVDNSLKRLVCFDKLAQRASGMQDIELPEFVQRQPVRRPANTDNYAAKPAPRYQNPEDTFGLKEESEPVEESKVSEITAVVTKLDKEGRGRLVITLDNGQVWKQSTGDTLRTLRVGEMIVISRGMLGAFYLKEHDGNERILVRRSS